MVAAGQVTDKGQGVWLSGNGGYILDMRSAKQIERLLGDKSSFIELKEQQGVDMIPFDDPSSSLFPLVEKESKQQSQVDKGDVEVEEDRPARVKGANTRHTAVGARRVWQGVQRKIVTKNRRTNRRCHWWPWTTDSLVAILTQTWPRPWCSSRGLQAQWGLSGAS